MWYLYVFHDFILLFDVFWWGIVGLISFRWFCFCFFVFEGVGYYHSLDLTGCIGLPIWLPLLPEQTIDVFQASPHSA